MRRGVSIAALSLLLVALPVWAQRRGGGGGGHAASHGGFAGHSSGAIHSSGSFRSSGAFRGGSAGRNKIHLRIGNSYYNRNGYYGRWGYPYYPYAGYYPWFWYDDYNDTGDQDAYASYAAPAYPPPAPEDEGLRQDVEALSGKIDRLQADVEARNHPKDEEPATALVFRDKHVEEVHNYAIAGGTLWVVSDHQAGKKIPLAQLDIDATIKMNDERGISFQVPGPSLQIMLMR